jgi:ketosteroid isomerase-like protein
MSRENVELVRRGFEAWEGGDLTGVLGLMSDEFVMRRHAPLPDPGTWPGREGLLDVAVDWGESFGEYTVRGEEFIDKGSHVIVRVFLEGRGADSGAPVTGVFWWVVEVRDGQAIALDICHTRERALEAAGLSE